MLSGQDKLTDEMKCLVLAGGFGTRLWPLTKDVPKPLLPIGGKPIISHIVEHVPRHIDITVSTNRIFETQFIRWEDSVSRSVHLLMEDAANDEHKLGPLRAIDHFIREERVDEDLMVVGGDNVFGFSLSDFVLAYSGRSALVAVYDVKDKEKAKKFGVVALEAGGKIASFVEKPPLPRTSLVATACYILPPRVFSYLPDCCGDSRANLGDFIAFLIHKEDVYAYLFNEYWFDIGTIQSYEEAKRVLAT